MNTLILKNINKHYKSKYVLKDFSYTFENGVYALLGPNGAGKSTLMNIISGNVSPDDGGIMCWNGENCFNSKSNYREVLGFMPQQQSLYDSFTAIHFLSYIAALKGISENNARKQIPELLEKVDLHQDKRKPIGSFSGGMKQRLLIAQALLGNPQLVLLDEPTAGLDPKQRVVIRNLIEELNGKAVVLVSTHIVSDVETIADKIIIMKSGEIVTEGKLSQLKSIIPKGKSKNLENVYMQYFGDEYEDFKV